MFLRLPVYYELRVGCLLLALVKTPPSRKRESITPSEHRGRGPGGPMAHPANPNEPLVNVPLEPSFTFTVPPL